MEDDAGGKRGRGRGRRARGRGARGGRGRGKRAAVVVSSDEESLGHQSLDEESSSAVVQQLNNAGSGHNVETSDDQPMHEGNKENEADITVAPAAVAVIVGSGVVGAAVTEEVNEHQRQTIDMEADISQLEAPTFTTISRGPPEPMLRLKWNHKVNLIGEKVLNPMIHCCDQCDKPILLYGRMIPCKHVFCLKCARAEPVKSCPRCSDMVLRVEQSGLGTVFMCTHGGSRYGNTGCRRTYLSQRDLQAHINHRHVTQPPPLSMVNMPATVGDTKAEVNLDAIKAVGQQRKLSESSGTPNIPTPSALLPQRQRNTGIGSIPPPGAVNIGCSTLTQANIARINSANEQQTHSSKVALHQTLKKTGITQSHQPPETVADASYYSSVLNSFGSGGGGSGGGGGGSGGSSGAGGGNTGVVDINAVGGNSGGGGGGPQSSSVSQQWAQNQYYR